MVDKNSQKIRKLFNDIAFCYDKMNDLISFHTHYLIRIMSLRFLDIKRNSKILDIACGTGDFAKIILEYYRDCVVIGMDNSENMLEVARKKISNTDFILSDCTKTDFQNDEFDYITMGFALRNIEKREEALNEIYRILKPHGRFLHLDFGKHNLIAKIFDFTTTFFINFFIAEKSHYEYLIESKNEYPEPDDLIEEFKLAGFKNFKMKYFLFKSICAIVCEK